MASLKTILLPAFMTGLGASLSQSCGEGTQPPPPPTILGSLELSWSLVDQDGEPVDCTELSLVETQVSIGGEPRTVPCGDPQTLTFESLIAQRYPIVIELLGIGGGKLYDALDNVVVQAGEPTKHTVTIEIDRSIASAGRLRVSWFVADQAPATGCGLLGADNILFKTQEGSIADFEVQADCIDGELLIGELQPGSYTVRASLRDVAGNTLPQGTREFEVLIMQTQESNETLTFSGVTERASFQGYWTITSSSAAEACAALNAQEVRIRLANDAPNGVEIATATAPCTDGGLRLEDLPAGVGEVRASFFLVDFFGAQLDSQTVFNLLLTGTNTTTVTVDFQLNE